METLRVHSPISKTFPANMSVASELPTVVSKPQKTRTKLPIYITAAIVVALAVVVVVINIVHRLPDTPDGDAWSKTTKAPLAISTAKLEPEPETESPNLTRTTTEAQLITSTVVVPSTSESDSSSSSSDEEHKDAENSTLVQVPTTVIPSTDQETTEAVNPGTVTVAVTTEQSTRSPAPATSEPLSESTAAPTMATVTVPSECGKKCRFVAWIEDTIHMISGYFDNLVDH